MNGTDAPTGRLGAVLRCLGEPDPVSLGPHGPYVTTSLAHARAVLTDPERFDFPMDVSRQPLRFRPGQGSSRSPHVITPPLSADAVAHGTRVFALELEASSSDLVPEARFDAMEFLRRAVARSTTAAVLVDLEERDRNRVADLVLAWIDSLAPIIASSRNPSRWSRVRREETKSREQLESTLAELGYDSPSVTGTVLAAGTQVPIAAGAWLLVKLAEDAALAQMTRARPDLSPAVAWETLRLCPPTWFTPRITAVAVRLGETQIPAGMVVLVSPLLLGRIETLAPGPAAGQAPMDRFDPLRWDQKQVRPGAWLPFGAGPHACPGRNLGLAQLIHLADWARGWTMVPVEPVQLDQSRGIFPNPARLHAALIPNDTAAARGPQQDGPA